VARRPSSDSITWDAHDGAAGDHRLIAGESGQGPGGHCGVHWSERSVEAAQALIRAIRKSEASILDMDGL